MSKLLRNGRRKKNDWNRKF